MRRDRFKASSLEPDEIFLDSKNLPGFDQERFEGRLEHPISRSSYVYLVLLLLAVISSFLYKSFELQVLNGAKFWARAESNRLRIVPVWPERGLIYDRNGKILASNKSAFRLLLDPFSMEGRGDPEKIQLLEKELKEQNKWGEESIEKALEIARKKKENLVLTTFYNWKEIDDLVRKHSELPLAIEPFSSRSYGAGEAFSHLLGYLSYPNEEDVKKEIIGSWQVPVGRTGVESQFEDQLKGKAGSKLSEVDSQGKIFSESVEDLPEHGKNIFLTIDSDIQERTFESLKNSVDNLGFRGGAAVVVDVKSGELLTLTSYPSFNAEIMTKGEPYEEIGKLFADASKPLYNRAIAGLYPSGSIIKPLMSVAALEEGVISPEREVLSTGTLTIPNPFHPGQPSIFYDWKAHGWVDMRRALAVSSNIYFYTVGGGFGDIKGLGIKKMQEWFGKFGLGEKTGIELGGEKEGLVPGPEWKSANDKDNPIWRVGDTYNLSIGQQALTVTPLQMAMYNAAIANGGAILKPQILKEVRERDRTVESRKPEIRKTIAINENNIRVVQEGMELMTHSGNAAQQLAGLKINMAGKTGTAEIGSGKTINSWFIGFLPYENPQIAFAVVLEAGPANAPVGATGVAKQIAEWLSIYQPELIR